MALSLQEGGAGIPRLHESVTTVLVRPRASPSQVARIVAPIKARYDREVAAVERRLEEEAERDKAKFLASLAEEKRSTEDRRARAVAKLEARVAAAKAEHDAAASRKAEIQKQVDDVEADTAALNALNAAAQAEIDGHDGRMAAAAAAAAAEAEREEARFEEEVEKRRRRIDAAHANFAFLDAKKASLAREHALERGALLDAHARELETIEAKIASKLRAQDEAKALKLAELADLRAKNAALERELADHRARDLLRESDDRDEPRGAAPERRGGARRERTAARRGARR